MAFLFHACVEQVSTTVLSKVINVILLSAMARFVKLSTTRPYIFMSRVFLEVDEGCCANDF